MRSRRLVTIAITLGGIGLCCLSQAGCGDDTKTTGTQLQLSEKDKAEIDGMREAMKNQRAVRKQAQQKKR